MMPSVVRLFALGVALALLAAGVVGIYAVFLRLRGRAVPRGVVRLLAGLVGAGFSFGFLYMEEPLTFAIFMSVPAYAAFELLRRGQGIAAGTMLIALGLPGAIWWGFFLAEDVLDPIELYDSILWLWWAPEVLLIVGGALLVVRGDRTVAAKEPMIFAKAATHVRNPAEIANAIQRALVIGSIPIPVLLGVGAALLVIWFGLVPAAQAGVPWPIALLAGALIFAALITELWLVAMPRGVRQAWEGYAALGSPEMKRWIAETGTRVPTSLRAMRRWLQRNPDRPETRWARAELLIIMGDLAGARVAIEGMPLHGASDRFEQHSLRDYLDWVEGEEPDFEALRAEAETVGEPGSAERFKARGTATIAVARDTAATGGDWMAPLIAIREEAGPVAGRMLRADIRRAFYPKLLPVGLFLSGVALLLGGIIGGI
jgi:hypothetical protein